MKEPPKQSTWPSKQYPINQSQKGKNKVSLRYQSVLLRTQGSNNCINYRIAGGTDEKYRRIC